MLSLELIGIIEEERIEIIKLGLLRCRYRIFLALFKLLLCLEQFVHQLIKVIFFRFAFRCSFNRSFWNKSIGSLARWLGSLGRCWPPGRRGSLGAACGLSLFFRFRAGVFL